MGQTNALYALLNWNTAEKQKSLIAWYDLQDPSTVQLSANQGVFRLQDKSIWKNHISQPTSFYQPLFISDSRLNAITAVNGISFANGGFMLLKFPTTKTVQDITSFVICKNSLGGSKLLYDLGIEGGEGIASCYAGLDKIESRVPNSLVAYDPNFISNPNQYLFIATRGSAGNVQASLNYSQYNGQGTRNFVGDQYNRIRLSTEPGDAPSDGTLYELILFDRKLNDEEYAKVKNYLIGKYNLQTIVYQKNTPAVSDSKTLFNSNVGPNQNAVRSPKSSLIEGNTKSIKQKSLSDQVADAVFQDGVNALLKALNDPNPSPAPSRSKSSNTNKFNSQLLNSDYEPFTPDSENSVKICDCCSKRFSTRGYNIHGTHKQITDAGYYAGRVTKPVFCSKVCASNFIKNNCK